MTRVRKAAAVSLMTPMVAAAICVGLTQPAEAAGCLLGSATITPPSGTVTAGSTVQVSANVSGLTLLNGKAHLQISGPGLDQQVGDSVMNGPIKGDVTVPKPGYFTLAVISNGTKCTYNEKDAGFSVKDEPSVAKPSIGSSPSRHTKSGGGSRGSSAGGGVPSLPTGGAGNGAGANDYTLNPLNRASPFSLPPVAPDGSQLQYPSPDPQVASPPAQPMARNVSQTTPIKWGQSLAVALVLLIISAHLGMWSRRQRLAAARASSGSGKPGGGPGVRRKSRKAGAMTAQASALADPSVRTAEPSGPTAGPAGATTLPIGMPGTEVFGLDGTRPSGVSKLHGAPHPAHRRRAGRHRVRNVG